MKVYFVRHGQTDSNKNRIMHGITDVHLNEDGIKQAEDAIAQIPKDISVVYCSPLSRCVQTAEIINKAFNFPIVYDDRLVERNFRSLEGRSWKEFDPDFEVKDKQRLEYDYREFGGEAVDDVKNRVLDFIGSLKTEKKGQKILVVSHGGVVRLVHKIINGKVEKIHNASLHEFDLPDN